MTEILLDFRFVELDYELWGLEQYRGILEEQVVYLQSQKTAQAEARLKKEGLTPDDPDYDLAMQELSELIHGVIPRFYRGPFLVALWGVFESGIEEVGRYIADKKHTPLRLSDIQGRSPKERCEKYFTHILNFDLGIDGDKWKQLEELRTIRNALAHCNGRISLLKKDARSQILCWVKDDRGIYIDFDFLILSKQYLETANLLIQQLLTDLIARAKADYLGEPAE
jgi:hypothetical protein